MVECLVVRTMRHPRTWETLLGRCPRLVRILGKQWVGVPGPAWLEKNFPSSRLRSWAFNKIVSRTSLASINGTNKAIGVLFPEGSIMSQRTVTINTGVPGERTRFLKGGGTGLVHVGATITIVRANFWARDIRDRSEYSITSCHRATGSRRGLEGVHGNMSQLIDGTYAIQVPSRIQTDDMWSKEARLSFPQVSYTQRLLP